MTKSLLAAARSSEIYVGPAARDPRRHPHANLTGSYGVGGVCGYLSAERIRGRSLVRIASNEAYSEAYCRAKKEYGSAITKLISVINRLDGWCFLAGKTMST
jgi:hypothetical protein